MASSNKKSTALSPKSGNVTKSDGTWINWADYLDDSTDAFGISISESTRNVADIASHYPHSPERHRLFINGTRFLLHYGSTAKFEDTSDSYTLKPAAGDVIRYQTAERFRYTVGYVIVPSIAFSTNQSLVGDDKIVIGYGEPDLENDMANANGWFWEYRGGEPDDRVYLTVYRDGTLVDSVQVNGIKKAHSIWQRIEDRINWYNVGARQARQTYTEDGKQYNPVVGRNSVDDGKGPSNANFRVVAAVKADASTTGLELDVGSIGVRIFGEVESIFRSKQAVQSGTHSGSGEFEPLFAVRKDPNNLNVFINLSDVQILEVSVDDDVEILAQSIDPSKTDAASWGVPIYHSATNSAMQETTSVTTFPDSAGTVGTSHADPGGYQVGFTSYYAAGTGTANRRSTQTRGVRKRPFNNGDYIIFLAKTDSAMTITLNYETEQQW